MSLQGYVMPIILGLFGLGCLLSKKDIQASFLRGADEGLRGAFSLITILVPLMTAVSVFNASGASDILTQILAPVLKLLRIPHELSPLLIVRPVSGSGSTAVLSDILTKYGPDSFVGLCASVICASSDTVLYIVSLYMSAAGVKSGRYALPAALTVSAFGTVLSCILVRAFC